MGTKIYNIIKRFSNGTEVRMTDGTSEVLTIAQKNVAQKMVDVLNANTDSGCHYRLEEAFDNTELGNYFNNDYPLIQD